MNHPQRQHANGLYQGPDNTHLRTMFWNAGGLTNAKFTELKNFIFENDIDVYGIAEAGAATDHLSRFGIPGYQTYCLGRQRQVSSGIIVGAKSSLVVDFKIRKEMEGSDKLEVVELAVWKSKLSHRFLFAYNPPNNTPDLCWLEAIWDRKCILAADLNAPSTRWGYQNTDRVGKIWEDFIDSNAAVFIDNKHMEPTFLSYRGGTSHPDILVAHPSLTSLLKHTVSAAPGGFGHKILQTELMSRKHYQAKEKRRPRWNFKKADWNKYKKLTDDFITEALIDHNVDQSLKRIQEGIFKCAQQCIPRGQMPRYRPFWNDELQTLKEERDRARHEVEVRCSTFNQKVLKEKSINLKTKILEAKRNKYMEVLENLDYRKDGIKAHRYVSTLNGEKDKFSNPFTVAGKTLTSEKEIAKHFCKHYASVGNYHPKRMKVKPSVNNDPDLKLSMEDQFLLNGPLQLNELNRALRDTPKGKSAGPDEILPEFLIHAGPEARKALLKFLNLVWINHYPAEWRKAEIIPILKKGKPADQPSSYRPISLTSLFSKVYERILLQRLQRFLENNKLISSIQAGFRRNRGTVEQVARLAQHIKDGFHRKQSTLAVLVDFKTAFDRVWRQKLMCKISSLGINGNMFAAIASFLSQRFIRVRYQDSASPYKQLKQGIPQGSVLSPCLFNIMINDVTQILEEVPGVQGLLYADDLIVWATSSDIAALEPCLNKVLVKLKLWADSNEMVINPLKTECQLFTLSTKPHNISLNYDNQNIAQTDKAIYLGVTLDSKLSWSKHIKKLCEQGESRSNLLRRLTGVKWGASQDVLSLTYKAYVRPSLEYGSALVVTASEPNLRKLDLVQNKAMRVITGGPKSTPIAAMEVQTGIEPLGMRREAAAMVLYERLKRSTDTYWETYAPANERLKTQKTFFSSAEKLMGKCDPTLISIIRQPWLTLRDLAPSKLADRQLGLNALVQKGVTPHYEAKQIFLETVAIRYPSPDWLHIYTDGSAKGASQDVGAGVFCKEFELSTPVGKLASNFDGEIKAINLALEHLLLREDPKVVIFVDSQSAIIAVTENELCDEQTVVKCRQLSQDIINRGCCLCFQWCPSHCGIFGNERADYLAKQATYMLQPELPLTFRTSKRIIKKKTQEALKKAQKDIAKGRSWETLLEEPIPRTLGRQVSVACFRMLTGHDFLAQHLHRIGVLSSPICTLCHDGEMSPDHILTCPSIGDVVFKEDDTEWTKKSKIYWAARTKMSS